VGATGSLTVDLKVDNAACFSLMKCNQGSPGTEQRAQIRSFGKNMNCWRASSSPDTKQRALSVGLFLGVRCERLDNTTAKAHFVRQRAWGAVDPSQAQPIRRRRA